MFNPGDKVAILYRGEVQGIHQVSSVTPSGRVRVAVGSFSVQEFNADGWERGAGRTFGRRRIVPVDDDIRERLARATALRIVGIAQWNDLSTDQLRRIVAIIEEPTP